MRCSWRARYGILDPVAGVFQMWDLAETEVASNKYKANVEEYKGRGKEAKARTLGGDCFRSYVEVQCGSKQLAW